MSHYDTALINVSYWYVSEG